MSDFDFTEWDNEFDSESLKKELVNTENSSGDYKEVPHGEYEVKITKLELTKSKSGKPMVSCWFKILAGEYKEQMIFMNQPIVPVFGLHKCNEFLRTLSSLSVSFESFEQYAKLLTDILNEIDGKYEYQLNYGGQVSKKDGKTYNTFKIEKTFEATPF